MVNAEASDFFTLYTTMKNAQKICATLGQRESVITFDLALYVKAKQLPMKYLEEFNNTVIRMGGFHIALNYLSLLGKKYAQSGIEDLFIESGVYAAGATSAVMHGKFTAEASALTSSPWKHYSGFCGRLSWKNCKSKKLRRTM